MTWPSACAVVLLALSIPASSTPSPAAAETSPLWVGLPQGPHPVGYELIEAYDVSRPFREKKDYPDMDPKQRARRLPMSIWYPAKDVSRPQRIPFSRYVDASNPRDARGRITEASRRAALEELSLRMASSGWRWTPDQVDRLLETPTGAHENAPHLEGPFPLIVLGTGLTAPSYLHTVLAELLASYGYIVVGIPSFPPRENVEPAYDLLAVETQIRDMEMVIGWMHDYPHVEAGNLGLVAWSLGGVSQALLQMKNGDVGAVVSLDGATGYEYGRALLERSIHFDPSRATAPFLHVTDASKRTGSAAKSFEYLRSTVRGRTYLLTVSGLDHGAFTSLGGVVPHTVVPREDSATVLESHATVMEYVVRFLGAALKEDDGGWTFLEAAPTRHGYQNVILASPSSARD